MFSIELQPAQRDELQTIENLMQLYLHDFSEWLPLKLGEQGLYRLRDLQDYWRNPATLPFLIMVDGELGGFVTVDNVVHLQGAEHNIGYLFLGRRFRGKGVAQSVVCSLLSRLPGEWQIFHIDANQPARLFWARVIDDLSGGVYRLHQQSVDGYPCTFYRFRSPQSRC